MHAWNRNSLVHRLRDSRVMLTRNGPDSIARERGGGKEEGSKPHRTTTIPNISTYRSDLLYHRLKNKCELAIAHRTLSGELRQAE